MTEREAIIILSMFADQYKGKTIHSILNNNKCLDYINLDDSL